MHSTDVEMNLFHAYNSPTWQMALPSHKNGIHPIFVSFGNRIFFRNAVSKENTREFHCYL